MRNLSVGSVSVWILDSVEASMLVDFSSDFLAGHRNEMHSLGFPLW
jgi:hypothetical protein